jgi:glycosyltransferase involved in cell wall biosynthesis
MTSPLSVIVPVYNEAQFIATILQRIQANPIVKEIIVIDDCSKDGTRDILKKLKEDASYAQSRQINSSAIQFIFHDVNQGKGAAIRTGIQSASGDLLVIQDADFEYDPAEYKKLIEPLLSGEADVVFGSRFYNEGWKALLSWHTMGNKFLTLVSNIFTGLNLTDMETCYKVFKTELIQKIPLRANRFGFEPEITAKIAKLKCRIKEVPISYKARTYAEGKKINWKDGISAINTIVKFWLIDDVGSATN